MERIRRAPAHKIKPECLRGMKPAPRIHALIETGRGIGPEDAGATAANAERCQLLRRTVCFKAGFRQMSE
jgi:hypothetical protein